MAMNLNIKAKIVLKYFLAVLFIAYYVSNTSFYHSHIVNGVSIIHSHFYRYHSGEKAEPVTHSHSDNEFVILKIITQFVTAALTGFVVFRLFLMVLAHYQIPLKQIILSSFRQSGFSLRAPPFA